MMNSEDYDNTSFTAEDQERFDTIMQTATLIPVAGHALKGAQMCAPFVKRVYYRNAHHTQKVIDFIQSSFPGVPAISGAGAAGAYIQDKFHPEKIFK